MKHSTFPEEQSSTILRQAEQGAATIGDVCRAHGIAESTFYTWLWWLPSSSAPAATHFSSIRLLFGTHDEGHQELGMR